MTSAIDRLNDDLYHAGDSDMLFVIRWPPNMNENAVTKHELLNDLHPAPLPPLPPVVDPPLPPTPVTPPPAAVDTLVVNASAGLSIRAAPSTAAAKVGALANGDTVEVSGSIVAGQYHFGQLMRVNGLKYAAIGWIAREYLAPPK